MKILLTGGGTAGHITPIISLIDKIKAQNLEYLYVGSEGMEKKIAESNHLNFESIPAGKWRNYFSLENIGDLLKTFRGILRARQILNKFKPDVVFAKGGYVTFPILFWVKRWRIPLVIHESDIVPGKANIWASKFARKICVGFPVGNNYRDFPSDKIVYTGIPTRNVEVEHENSKPIILITGGSQGAAKINEIVKEALPQLLEKFEIYHQVGEKNYKSDSAQNGYHQFGFDQDILKIMARADIVVSRAGATTMAELARLKKPVIVIPYPYAAGNHQQLNANYLKDNHAVEVIIESDLSKELLVEKINSILTGPDKSELPQNLARIFKITAADEIMQILIENSNDKNNR